ncbi:TPA: IS200/IS605 family transposase, partial [Streptococcus suis]|nr:IS200/IS605 family transposase [Streptococcus suis]HEM4264870.1 IS200/IS605 family transposase [Streptococcus suis]
FLHELKSRKRVKHDIALDKLSVKEYEDPFRDNGK